MRCDRSALLLRSAKAFLMAFLLFGLLSTGGAGPLNYRTSWLGNTWGGADRRYVPIDAEAMCVSPDGTVYTNAIWDEDGGEIAQFRDGQLVGFGRGTHGYGNLGGQAIALNGKYLYAAVSIDNEGGGLVGKGDYPPKGMKWWGVTRRMLGDIEQGAPFDGGLGNLGNKAARSFLKINTLPDKVDGGIRGLAADDALVFVSNPRENRVVVFNAETMAQSGQWPVNAPGRLALAADHTLWVIQHGAQPAIGHYARDGKRLGSSVLLPAGADPVALAFDGAGRMLVADNGWRQQILRFAPDGSGFRPDGAIGAERGLLAPPAGKTGPLRFNGLTSVAVDKAGNVYVSMNGYGPGKLDQREVRTGMVVESYSAAGKRNWSLEGLLFVGGVDIDRGDPTTAYSGAQRFALNLDATQPGTEWSYVASTVDRFRFPDDPMLHLGGKERGLPMVRRIQGRRFLFMTDMFSAYLKIYRFDEKRSGDIAVPSGLFVRAPVAGDWPAGQPPQGEWIWRDENGNGRFDAGEYWGTRRNTPDATAWWVDARGDIWLGTQKQGVRRFAVQGLDKFGNPVYDYDHMTSYPVPAPINHVSRVQYDAQHDVMFITGGSAERPYDDRNWNGAGYVLARYDNWSKKPRLAFAVDLPLYSPVVAGGMGSGHSVAGFAAEGDYVFAVETFSATVRVYDAHNGGEVGFLRPGPEVGNTSGWVDVPHGITAYQRSNGEYIVLVEEDLRGKVIMYRWTPGQHG
jgi:hypothetical protein